MQFTSLTQFVRYCKMKPRHGNLELNVNTYKDQTSPFLHSNNGFETYGVVENQTIGGKEFSDLVVSGALFSLTRFENVTFRSCVFFGSRMENVTFANCTFTDCKFQFTAVVHCFFANTSLENCSWEASNTTKSSYYNCTMDYKTSHHLVRGSNRITLDPTYAEVA